MDTLLFSKEKPLLFDRADLDAEWLKIFLSRWGKVLPAGNENTHCLFADENISKELILSELNKVNFAVDFKDLGFHCFWVRLR